MDRNGLNMTNDQRGPAFEAAVQAAARRYIATTARRYVPVLVVAAFVLVVIAFVPSVRPTIGGSGTQSLSSGGGATGSVNGGTTSSGSTVGTGQGPAGSTGSAIGPGGAAIGTGGSSGTGAGASGAGLPPGVAVGQPGVARSGVSCRRGVRQLSFSAYSALCVPRWSGNNGGSTAHGVTKDTITVSFRISNSGESGAVEAVAGPALNTTQQQYLADLQTYVTLFNKQFELYGRHVVVKSFQGQGDWVQEYQGQDLAAAEADAETAAKTVGAFADASTIAEVSTPPYTQDLANNHVIGIGGVSASQRFFESNAPYTYAIGGTVTNLDQFYTPLVCQRMVGLPAIFSGDATYQKTTRKFGLIYPDNPDYAAVGKSLEAHLKACGANPYPVSYSIDIPTLQQQDTNIMAQMHSRGITTVVCVCDLLSPNFLTTAADGQQYYPEWLDADGGDPYGQTYRQDQWNHAIVPGGTSPNINRSEAYRAYRLVHPNSAPQEQYFYLAYQVALQLFDAIQNAGPNLTPNTFEQGMFSLPSSAPGAELGHWGFGRNHFTTLDRIPIGYWDPNKTSPMNGKAGTYISCSGADGREHPFGDPAAFGRAHTQLRCFG
jgi:hypothetical protein